MAAKHEQTFVMSVRINQLVGAFRAPNFCSQLKLEFIAENTTGNGIFYQFSHSVSFSSWGEDITILLTPMGDVATQMSIRSECSMPTQIVDWGKNKQMVNKIYEHLLVNAPLQSVDHPLPQTPYPAPQPTPQPAPAYQPPQQPAYQAPAQSAYQAPPQPVYQAPAQPVYQAPPQPQYPCAPVCNHCRRPMNTPGNFCPFCGARR